MVGLLFSVLGDWMLPFPDQIATLLAVVSLLIGQALYIFASNKTPRIPLIFPALLPFLLLAIFGYLVLVKHIEKGLRVLILCYVLILAMNCWRSTARLYIEGKEFGAVRAVLGSILRVISDSVMLAHMFHPASFANKAIPTYVVSLYFLSQYMVATSVQFGSQAVAAGVSKKKKV
eukprot:c7625_g1_i2.p1 GENE.c7625_g1_i2~~c7625_g1_i2.p1  ORF type:complete len:175 (+),score=40.01 c7625_g1_i2:325-849(+)